VLELEGETESSQSEDQFNSPSRSGSSLQGAACIHFRKLPSGWHTAVYACSLGCGHSRLHVSTSDDLHEMNYALTRPPLLHFPFSGLKVYKVLVSPRRVENLTTSECHVWRLRACTKESQFDTLPDEMVLAVFMWVALLHPKTMLTVVHAVCRRWGQLCGDTQDVRLDFRFLPKRAKLRFAEMDAPVRPAEAAMVASLARLAGRFKHVVQCNLDRVLTRSADLHVISLAEHCPQLTHVNFTGCDQLTDTSVVVLAEHCPHLTHVNFSQCSQLTITSMVALGELCPHLAHVNFCSCPTLSDSSVVALAEHCPQLTFVRFSGCDQLTDMSVVALAEHCPLLTFVNFSGCDQLTDPSLVTLGEHCLHLTHVNFVNCPRLTDASLVALAEHCPQLTYMNFSGAQS
jgi:hypothetical protein